MRVRLDVDRLERGYVVVRVTLRTCQRRVPQQHLYVPYVGAAVEQVCRKSVPQSVWAALSGNTVLPQGVVDDPVDGRSGNAFALVC